MKKTAWFVASIFGRLRIGLYVFKCSQCVLKVQK